MKKADGDDDELDDEIFGTAISDEDAAHLEDTMGAVAAESGQSMFAQVGNTDREDMFGQINRRAAAWAKQNVGQLISGVDDTTREAVRGQIAAGLEAGKTRDEIADELEDAWQFGEARSMLIANTEIADANSAGGLEGARTARDRLGIESYKEWLLGPNPCEVCEDNADDGPIPLDEVFSSGDDAPSAHPNCVCALTYVAAPSEED